MIRHFSICHLLCLHEQILWPSAAESYPCVRAFRASQVCFYSLMIWCLRMPVNAAVMRVNGAFPLHTVIMALLFTPSCYQRGWKHHWNRCIHTQTHCCFPQVNPLWCISAPQWVNQLGWWSGLYAGSVGFPFRTTTKHTMKTTASYNQVWRWMLVGKWETDQNRPGSFFLFGGFLTVFAQFRIN